MAISKNILVREVSKKTKLGPEEVSVVIDTFIETIQEHACKGEAVVILEAMKMENALVAPCDGVIKAIGFKSGDTVAKGAALCVIG